MIQALLTAGCSRSVLMMGHPTSGGSPPQSTSFARLQYSSSVAGGSEYVSRARGWARPLLKEPPLALMLYTESTVGGLHHTLTRRREKSPHLSEVPILGVFSPLRTNGKEDGKSGKVLHAFCSLIVRTHVGLILFHEMDEQ